MRKGRNKQTQHQSLLLGSSILLLPLADKAFLLPDAAGVVLRSRDNRVALVVERARENFVFVALSWVSAQALQLCARLR